MSEKLKEKITSLLIQKKETEISIFLSENPKFNLFESIDDKNNNSIHRICFINSNTIFSIALEHIKKNKQSQDIKSLINNKNSSGFTPLHYACYKGNLEIIIKLINLGADIYLKNNKGLNILHLASQGNQINILAYFIEKYNFDPMSLDDVYSTPLHWACYFGCENCADFLLSLKRVKINFCDKEGRTPLHVAIFSDNIHLIKKLIRYGADKNIKDINDNTPLEIAEIKKKKKLLKF
jgi:ankyrin repeat protein